VVTTPHGTVFQDAVAVSLLPKVSGSFADFGAPEIKFNLQTDYDLASAIVDAGVDLGVPTVGLGEDEIHRYRTGSRLDHGVLVPWYYLAQAGSRIANCVGRYVTIAAGRLIRLWRSGKTGQ